MGIWNNLLRRVSLAPKGDWVARPECGVGVLQLLDFLLMLGGESCQCGVVIVLGLGEALG